ncbi:tight junction-associated protein 1 isoform X2 [Halyomorpha halys]|uniref:tight junction-associated protein 1 isoform X2 n=1 Tax=Halyomorpha halys TaxID=286706 RepID=UPI0034D21BD7
MSQKVKSCKGCGCTCRDCEDQAGLHLHVEIENLKQQLLERENHILSMETNFLKEADKFPNGEVAAISEELLTWQDKYSRLYEAHKRVQRVNQNLEDKLLRIVDKCETEKNALTSEVSNLTRRLVDEKFNVARLQEENERYRNDVNLAIQLLQCKPSNFVSQKYDSLPTEMQQKVRTYLSNKRRQSDGNGNLQPKPEMKTIKVPIPTYPPTAMVYSVNKCPLVSAAIMAKILEERERERSQAKHCGTCTCRKVKCTKSTQTLTDLNCSEACFNPPSNGGLRIRESRRVAEGILVNLEPHSEDDLISFGPRQCSLRVQPGSSSVLVGGSVAPVIYRSRTSDPLVHAPRSASVSSDEGKPTVRTETEI